ncbi:MAG: alpha/beta fold hydrolase [Marinirhabdus sp.]
MTPQLKTEGEFTYLELGEGTPIVILHGLMGGLSNFDSVAKFFPERGYKILIPELPLYKMPVLKTNVKNFAKFVKAFLDHKKIKGVVVLGNSLGGHIGLLCTKLYPDYVKALVITGSSGLYESAMGESYPKRGDRDYIQKKVENVFYDPKIATKEIVDSVYATVNDRHKLLRTLAIAKSAIRHNMGRDLPKIKPPTCIIWGKNDTVTPPDVAEEFHEKLPDSDLYWIDKCGHAAMMEHPETFNKLLYGWLVQRGI